MTNFYFLDKKKKKSTNVAPRRFQVTLKIRLTFSLSCMLVPVQYREYQYGLYRRFWPVKTLFAIIKIVFLF